MAEKEERIKDLIYVFSQEFICKNCKDWYEHIDPLDKQDCDNCEDIADLPHISRQEAIERMEKVLEEGWWSGKTFRQISEAALNALLSKED